MEFVKASMKYLEQMCEITDQAKRQLAGLGLDQWQKGYPSREVWLSDIEEGCTYLAVDEEKVLGIFAFQTTPDPSYGEIEGKWLTDGPYASMHRVCVADGCKGKGVAISCGADRYPPGEPAYAKSACQSRISALRQHPSGRRN